MSSFESDDEQALDDALARGRLDLVESLVAAGAQPFNVALSAAAIPGNTLEELVAKGVVSKGALGEALSLACSYGDFEAAKALLAAGADPNHLDPDQRSTPLLEVLEARSPDPALFRMLLEAGAEPNPSETMDPLLYTACKYDAVECARALIEAGVNVHARTIDGFAPLTISVHNVELVQLLLDAGADPAKSVRSPLEFARRSGNADPKAIRLLERVEVDVPREERPTGPGAR